MKSPAEILAQLANCTGTYHYYKASPFAKKFVYTDGIQHLINLCECNWLIDIVTSVNKIDEFQLWKINVDQKKSKAVVTCEDGNDNVLYTQKIPYTDFPIEEFSFYCTLGSLDGINPLFVIMLKSEY